MKCIRLVIPVVILVLSMVACDEDDPYAGVSGTVVNKVYDEPEASIFPQPATFWLVLRTAKSKEEWVPVSAQEWGEINLGDRYSVPKS